MARFLLVSLCVVAALANSEVCSDQEDCIAGSSLLATNAKPVRTPPAPAPAPAEAAAAGNPGLAIDTPGVETLKTLATDQGVLSVTAKASATDMDQQQKASEGSATDASKKAEAAGEARIAHQSASEAAKYAKELAAVASTDREGAIKAHDSAAAAKMSFDQMATDEQTALTELNEERTDFKKQDVDTNTKEMLAQSAKDDLGQSNAKKQEADDKYKAATEAVFQAKRRKEKAEEILTQARNMASDAATKKANAAKATNDAEILANEEMQTEEKEELALGSIRTDSAQADVKDNIAMANLQEARETYTAATAEANARTEVAVEDEEKAAESVISAERLASKAKGLADKVQTAPLPAGAFEGFSGGGAAGEVNPVAEAIAVEDAE